MTFLQVFLDIESKLYIPKYNFDYNRGVEISSNNEYEI